MGKVQRALASIKQTKKKMLNPKQRMLRRMCIQIDSQHEVDVCQSDIAREQFLTPSELAGCDREVTMITTGKPQWEEQEVQFQVFYPECHDTERTVMVRQTTTRATLWQQAQNMLNAEGEKAKLQSIYVVLDQIRTEELTKNNAGSKQLGEIAQTHSSIILRTQGSPQEGLRPVADKQ